MSKVKRKVKKYEGWFSSGSARWCRYRIDVEKQLDGWFWWNEFEGFKLWHRRENGTSEHLCSKYIEISKTPLVCYKDSKAPPPDFPGANQCNPTHTS